MRVGCKDKPEKNNGPQINCNNKDVRANGSGYQVKSDSITYRYVVRQKLMREQIMKMSFPLLAFDV